MNEELKKLLDSINAKKQEVKDLCNAKKIDEAIEAKAQLKDMQAQFNLLYDLDVAKLDDMENKAASGTAKKALDKTENINIVTIEKLATEMKSIHESLDQTILRLNQLKKDSVSEDADKWKKFTWYIFITIVGYILKAIATKLGFN